MINGQHAFIAKSIHPLAVIGPNLFQLFDCFRSTRRPQFDGLAKMAKQKGFMAWMLPDQPKIFLQNQIYCLLVAMRNLSQPVSIKKKTR